MDISQKMSGFKSKLYLQGFVLLDPKLQEPKLQEQKQGILQGASRFHELMRILAAQGYPMDEILAMTEREENREKLYQQYGIA